MITESMNEPPEQPINWIFIAVVMTMLVAMIMFFFTMGYENTARQKAIHHTAGYWEYQEFVTHNSKYGAKP